MRVLLDACVLVPTLTRALILELAKSGAIEPLWSPQILAEWQHAAKRSGPLESMAVEGEIAVLNATYPSASITPDPDLIAQLYLPDPDDTHVLAAAIAGQAQHLVTFNARDFPTRILGDYRIIRTSPDALLLHHAMLLHIEPLLRAQIAQAQTATGLSPRALLKKSQLPRLGKALFPRP